MSLHNLADESRKNNHIMRSPAKKSSLTFDDLYQEISDHWQEKARRLQARRWRMIKHQDI